MNDTQASMEMPKYQSKKKVWALHIEDLKELSDGSGFIHPKEEGYASFPVSAEYMTKHKPYAGGVYVVYKDGYESFSPADVFAEGNDLI